ncbi:MAG: transcriptional regulator [Bacteroidetes bacterium CG12_big_fil_rev_8_21_14_0_65_60_17]|nr:MAG: transcriptional regulator [Bacteroidetes bacterium CG12_big_fil_rev_8_21_14_0_65_60_17]
MPDQRPDPVVVTDRTCVRTEVDEELLSSLRASVFGDDFILALAAFMKTVGNETRLRIVRALWEARELCVCDLADVLGISQPAVSRHLKLLREKGLVTSRRSAQTLYYRIHEVSPFADMLVHLFENRAVEHIDLNVTLTTSNAENASS